MDGYLKSLIADTYADLAPDEERRRELGGMLEAMWRECVEKRAFGYSDHQLALVPELPNLFCMVKPLITSRADFARFCRAIPVIVDWLPYFSEESPVGYMHTILTGPFDSRVQTCRTLDEFLGGFEGQPVSVCADCGRDMAVERRESGYTLTCTCGAMVVC